jgi:hypothetical protein
MGVEELIVGRVYQSVDSEQVIVRYDGDSKGSGFGMCSRPTSGFNMAAQENWRDVTDDVNTLLMPKVEAQLDETKNVKTWFERQEEAREALLKFNHQNVVLSGSRKKEAVEEDKEEEEVFLIDNTYINIYSHSSARYIGAFRGKDRSDNEVRMTNITAWRNLTDLLDVETMFNSSSEVSTLGVEKEGIRQFDTGANRNSDEGKLDFEGFLSPTVLEAYAVYMNSNRTLENGTVRDSDNWQKGIPKDAYMKSMWRHFFDVWKDHRGLSTSEDDITNLCGLLFNVNGMLHEKLKEK